VSAVNDPVPAAGRDLPVIVIGAGMSGVTCARELTAAGHDVRVLDRGRRPGGRMANRTVEGRQVDVGAAYFTAREAGFRAVVADWAERGLAHEWTDTFHLGTPEGLIAPKLGPVRYAARHGLRSLVVDLAAGLDIDSAHEVEEVTPGPRVDGVLARAVVLAMPDPQALDLLSDALVAERKALDGADWEPTIALYAGWDQRCWPELDGVFVEDSSVLSFIADDGRRRGDGAPVLVAHSGGAFAAGRLDDPETATAPMLAELSAVLGIDRPPRWADVKRWSLARPHESHAPPCYLSDSLIGACGDGWNGGSRVESAFVSGRELGRALSVRLRCAGDD
jgi:renalase